MSAVPYTPLAGKIKDYFDKLQEVSIPNKVTYKWLEALGFKSTNDRHIVKVLDAIGFIDKKVPTDLWRRYKNPMEAPVVLAEAIRKGYDDLFRTYEDAQRKDREALYAFFSSKTGKAKLTVDLMVNTFVNLCQLADFEAIPMPPIPELPKPEVPEKAIIPEVPEKAIIPEIHINIQLHLPETKDSSVYDNLFKSLKKHLLSVED